MADEVLGVRVGQKASISRTVTEQDIVAFARVTGDTNPLHLDDSYAKKTRFQQRVAHGILSAGFISAVLGTKLTGPNATAVYLSQSMRFLKPVFIGDTVTAVAEVKSVDTARRFVNLTTECFNQKGEKVLSGEALMLLDPMPAAGG